jgi:hypothetical protein
LEQREVLKLKQSWEGLYRVVAWINVVYQIQRHVRGGTMVVHLDRLTPYLEATQDEQP